MDRTRSPCELLDTVHQEDERRNTRHLGLSVRKPAPQGVREGRSFADPEHRGRIGRSPIRRERFAAKVDRVVINRVEFDRLHISGRGPAGPGSRTSRELSSSQARMREASDSSSSMGSISIGGTRDGSRARATCAQSPGPDSGTDTSRAGPPRCQPACHRKDSSYAGTSSLSCWATSRSSPMTCCNSASSSRLIVQLASQSAANAMASRSLGSATSSALASWVVPSGWVTVMTITRASPTESSSASSSAGAATDRAVGSSPAPIQRRSTVLASLVGEMTGAV